MGLKIYTYSNPYHIDDELFWPEVSNCPQFCASHTLANGMKKVYPSVGTKGRISTIDRLINQLYSDWGTQKTKVAQTIALDNAISVIGSETHLDENIIKSLRFNTKSIVDSLRIFSELGLSPDSFSKSNINEDQRLIVDLYSKVFEADYNPFAFSKHKTVDEINAAIRSALLEANPQDTCDVDLSKIVFHGIHQFSPAILCAIEEMSKSKEVILIFNYQAQYKEIYQTWINIYSLFYTSIQTNSSNEYTPNSLFVDSFLSNVLADSIGKLSDGTLDECPDELPEIEVTEFDNLTEFANYCAYIYRKAKNEAEVKKRHNALSLMEEQFYSPSSQVNDVLRSYFPEQFGERHFLDYPIGHFFIAVMNMWDNEKHCVKVDNYSDIRECLNSGIIHESASGVLINTFNRTLPFFENETTIFGVVNKLKIIKKYSGNVNESKRKVGYFNCTQQSVQELITALEDLEHIIESFFSDFDNAVDNFKHFYDKVRRFLTSKLDDMKDLDQEMEEVIRKLINKLQTTDIHDNGTYLCLKQTMGIYLAQDDTVGKSANWIVRGFEQIDGDILRSQGQLDDGKTVVYHFCCLSDNDICNGNKSNLPWPLDTSFFENAQVPFDSKFQIFLKSRLEYKNFNRYALVYGLEFNRVGMRLSYVKNESGKTSDLYHVFRLLGIKTVPYKLANSSLSEPRPKFELANCSFSGTDLDLIKASICPFKFALESLVQGQTVFRDRFLIHHYFRALIKSAILVSFSGRIFDSDELKREIDNQYQNILASFRITDDIEKAQILNSTFNEIKAKYVKKNRYGPFTSTQLARIEQLSDIIDLDILNGLDSVLSQQEFEAILLKHQYGKRISKHCRFCASKDVCLKYKR